jgi:hypothetical protein
MLSSNLYRSSALACILSGLLLPISWIMEVLLESAPTLISMSLDFVAITLLIFALMGIYFYQHESSGVSGFLGFLLAVLMACIGLSVISWAPDHDLVSETTEMLTLLMGVVGLVGYILLGIGSWKANVLPRWSIGLWPLGYAISAVGGMAENAEILHVIGISIWAMGIIGAGTKLWSVTKAPA